MECNSCRMEFEPKHFNQKLCSDRCRLTEKRKSKQKYKTTDKGRASELRWRVSDARKGTEKRYRSKPATKELAGLRRKRYGSTEKGKITKLNSDHRRRMRKKSGKITAEEWAQKLKEFDHCCANCGTKEDIQMDHVVPLSKGGPHHIDNIQPLCRTCNASKGAKLEWAG